MIVEGLHVKFAWHWDHEPRSRRGNGGGFCGEGDCFRLVASAATQRFMESRHFLKLIGPMNRLGSAASDRLRTADPTPCGGVASPVLRRPKRRCEGSWEASTSSKLRNLGHEPAGPTGRVSPLRAVCHSKPRRARSDAPYPSGSWKASFSI